MSNDTWAMIICMILLALAGGVVHIVLLVIRLSGKVDALAGIELEVKRHGEAVAVLTTRVDEHGRRLEGHGEKIAQVQLLSRHGRAAEGSA